MLEISKTIFKILCFFFLVSLSTTKTRDLVFLFIFPEKKNKSHKVVLKNNSALKISCLILPIQMSYSSESY